jgi:hydroxymethylpyrimidine pyrophosphatase-like HAD family hydrolase
MDNAPAAIKERAAAFAAVVAPGNDEEGVAWAIREFV